MPSKERFQTRPIGRVFKRRLLSRNFVFRYRQQPKLRKLDVVCFLVVFLANAIDSSTNSGLVQAWFCPSRDHANGLARRFRAEPPGMEGGNHSRIKLTPDGFPASEVWHICRNTAVFVRAVRHRNGENN